MPIFNDSLFNQPALTHSSLPVSWESSCLNPPTSASTSAVQNSTQLNSKHSRSKSRQHLFRPLPSVGFQASSPGPQPFNAKRRVFPESCRNPQVPMDPQKAVVTSPRKETLL